MISRFPRLLAFLRLGIPASLLSLPSVCAACPFCFTDQNSPQIRSGEAGVAVMVGVVVFVLSMIGSLAFQWARRARKIEAAAVRGPTGL